MSLLPRRRFTLGLTAACGLAALPGLAVAQAPGARPVRLVVPFAPGGAADILGRLLAERLSAAWGQPVTVDNKPGASGHLGAQFVARSAPDGDTLLVGTIGIHAAYRSYSRLAYDPGRELQVIAILGESPNVVLVRPDAPWKTLAALADAARAQPGAIRFASAGPGSSVHMVTALFEQAAGVRMTHVPYKGSGPALIDLVGGQVDVMFDNMSSGLPMAQAGRLRALAVTGAAREPALPGVPTVAEAGWPGYSGTSWFTLAAPSGLPAGLAARLDHDVQQAFSSADVAARLARLGVHFTPQPQAQAEAFVQAETRKWTRLIEATRLQLD